MVGVVPPGREEEGRPAMAHSLRFVLSLSKGRLFFLPGATRPTHRPL